MVNTQVLLELECLYRHRQQHSFLKIPPPGYRPDQNRPFLTYPRRPSWVYCPECSIPYLFGFSSLEVEQRNIEQLFRSANNEQAELMRQVAHLHSNLDAYAPDIFSSKEVRFGVK